MSKYREEGLQRFGEAVYRFEYRGEFLQFYKQEKLNLTQRSVQFTKKNVEAEMLVSRGQRMHNPTS